MRAALLSAVLALGFVPAGAVAQDGVQPEGATGIERAKRDDADIAATVHFATGSAVLGAPARRILDGFAARLASTAAARIEVDGHTDSSGAARFNEQLSDQRARAVMDYLASRGVAPGRITPIGYGPDQPVAPNDTEQGRSRNRRAELKIVQ